MEASKNLSKIWLRGESRRFHQGPSARYMRLVGEGHTPLSTLPDYPSFFQSKHNCKEKWYQGVWFLLFSGNTFSYFDIKTHQQKIPKQDIKSNGRWIYLRFLGNTSLLLWLNHLWIIHIIQMRLLLWKVIHSLVLWRSVFKDVFVLKIVFCGTTEGKGEGGHTEKGTWKI